MRKKRSEKRQPTAEERSRTADYRLKRYISKSAVDWAEQDQEIRRQMIFQTFGYKLPDPAEKAKSELLAHIDNLAIRRIDEDAELERKVTDARLRQVLGEMGLTFEDDEWRKKPLSIKDMIEKFKDVNELKKVLGVKEPGLLDIFKDPKFWTFILSIASAVISGRQSPAVNTGLVLVRIDGKDKIVTQEEYKDLKAQGRVKYLGKIEGAEPTNPSKGNETKSELEKSDEAEGEDGETGTVGSSD